MPKIENNIRQVTQRVEQSARDAGRDPAEVLLLAVSKTRSAEDIRCAVDAGLTNFGENYVQEAVEKIALLNKGKTEKSHCNGILLAPCNRIKPALSRKILTGCTVSIG